MRQGSSMEDGQELLKNVVSRVGDLPAMLSIIADVMETTDDPTVAMSEISEKIQRDPALTAKLLHVSNSAYYGLRQHVGTLNLALVVLGIREVRNVVLGISIFEMIHDPSIGSLVTETFWEHSVTVGSLSKKLGAKFALGLQGEDFIGGLLHDIGKMVLLRQLGEEYERILKLSGGSSRVLCPLEANKFGFDHADVAAALATHWNLPQALADALRFHHPNEDRELAKAKDPKLAALIRIANFASHDDCSQETGDSCLSCADDEAWSLLKSPNVPLDVNGRYETLAEFVAELEEKPEPLF